LIDLDGFTARSELGVFDLIDGNNLILGANFHAEKLLDFTLTVNLCKCIIVSVQGKNVARISKHAPDVLDKMRSDCTICFIAVDIKIRSTKKLF